MRYVPGTSRFLPLAEQVAPVVAKYANDVDTLARFPVESVAALRDSGLMGLLVPAEHGGLGGTLLDLIDVADRLAAECCSTGLVWAMHCQQVDAIVRFAPPELAAELLPPLARGELYVASVTTERGKGGHLLTTRSPLVRTADLLEVDRLAPVVTGGRHADGFLITMRESSTAAERSTCAVFAYLHELTVEADGSWDALGMRGTDSVSLRLTGEIPANRVLCAEGGWPEIVNHSMIPVAHLGWAATWLGTARRALAEFIALLRSPARPSSMDLSSPLIGERIARVRTCLELTGAYLHRVAEEVEDLRTRGARLDGTQTQIHLNTLKVAAAELTFEAVDRLVRLAGLNVGYRRGAPGALERRLRDLRAASLNNADDRLLVATGVLSLADREVGLA